MPLLSPGAAGIGAASHPGSMLAHRGHGCLTSSVAQAQRGAAVYAIRTWRTISRHDAGSRTFGRTTLRLNIVPASHHLAQAKRSPPQAGADGWHPSGPYSHTLRATVKYNMGAALHTAQLHVVHAYFGLTQNPDDPHFAKLTPLHWDVRPTETLAFR